MAVFGSVAAAIVELLGSVLALLVSLVFLQADIDRYRSSEKLVHIYGSRFGFSFFGPGVLRRFYDPSDVLWPPGHRLRGGTAWFARVGS